MNYDLDYARIIHKLSRSYRNYSRNFRACGGPFQSISPCIEDSKSKKSRLQWNILTHFPLAQRLHTASRRRREHFRISKPVCKGETSNLPAAGGNFLGVLELNIIKVVYFWPAAGENFLASFSGYLTGRPKKMSYLSPPLFQILAGQGGDKQFDIT